MKYKLRAEQHGPLKNMAVAGVFFILAGRSVAHGLKKNRMDGLGATCSKKNVYLLRTNRALVMD